MQKDKFIIHTSWLIYLQWVAFGLFLIFLDVISVSWTHTTFSFGVAQTVAVFFLACLIFCTKILIVSKDFITYWPHFMTRNRIPIKDISRIDVKISISSGYSRYVVVAGTMYFFNKTSKVLGELSSSTFDKKDLARFFQQVKLLNPKIEFNDKAEALSRGDDEHIKSQITKIYYNLLFSWITLSILIITMLGFIFFVVSFPR